MSKYISLIAGLVAILMCRNVCASSLLEPAPLQETIAHADVIVVARLIHYSPDRLAPSKEVVTHLNERTGGVIWEQTKTGNFIPRVTPAPLGQYTFQVVKNIKGVAGPIIKLDLNHISSLEYGYVVLRIQEGDMVLLMLRQSKDQQLLPVDSVVPVVRLKEDLSEKNEVASKATVQHSVVTYILNSLESNLFRRANTYLLRTIVDSSIPQSLSAFVNDQNLSTRDNVLYALATNQQVNVIAKIVQLQEKLSHDHSGSRSVEALANYTVHASIDPLQELLFQRNYYIRLNAVQSICRLADTSSIPFLLIALQDPDPQNIVVYSAYKKLQSLSPDLAQVADFEDFILRREELIQKVYAWWSNKINDKRRETLRNPSNIANRLFNPAIEVRREAIGGLLKTGGMDSIPYLLLAVKDPDLEVSYNSYCTLYRLLKSISTGAIISKSKFEIGRDSATAPFYQWWRDELTEKHQTTSPPRVEG